jgi:hypothetical protein
MANKPSKDTSSNSEFRRLYYARYADDFILGFVGTHCEAKEIFNEITAKLEKMELKVNTDKSMICHSSTQTKFLGSLIH